jgi:hypothetical protein
MKLKRYVNFINENDNLSRSERSLRKFGMGEVPFRSDLLYKSENIGPYELYVDGSTGWGIIFPSGYLEVEEGPALNQGWMSGEINGISISKRGEGVPIIPSKYWMGEMSKTKLKNFFDKVIKNFNKITQH